MLRILITALLASQGAQSFFLATSGPQAPLLRGHVQGLWPGPDKYQYNSRLEYHQAPGFQHFTDHHAFYEQGSSNLHPNILPPPESERPNDALEQQMFQAQVTPQLYQVPRLPTREPMFTGVPPSPLYASNLIQQGRVPSFSSYGVPQTAENLQQGAGSTETTIPIVVKLDNNQAVVVPVKAVYTLPPFLENLIQRIQAYYSVYNPVESFNLERPYDPPQVPSGLYEPIQHLPSEDVSQNLKESTTTPQSTSTASAAITSTSSSPEPQTEQEVPSSEPTTTLAPPSSSAPLSSSSEESSEEASSSESNGAPTISNEIASSTMTEAPSVESTTASQPPSSSSSTESTPEVSSQENASPDLESEGYTYNRPSRTFHF